MDFVIPTIFFALGVFAEWLFWTRCRRKHTAHLIEYRNQVAECLDSCLMMFRIGDADKSIEMLQQVIQQLRDDPQEEEI